MDSATLLIEYETPELRAVWLPALLGLEDHVWIEVPGFDPVRARFDTRQISTDRLSSVQYIKFALGPERAARLAAGTRIFADHPKYQASAELTAAQAAELSLDLMG